MPNRRPSAQSLIFIVSLGFGLLCFVTISRSGVESGLLREFLAIAPLQILALGYWGYTQWRKKHP
ncbi:hypothetical protein VB712_06120 [Spirulina sp. CCNP1310]|uniref:hypothetical protein n=1 Tax=Spirulina sp. CCNP1310 TaxID=3110249 RepID=UPI002B1F1E2A|nr:hypothetical protein [Spirulina sp. CCNP1310]MEA5418796.1 hypothetical protein [Spirulina sp. CCNP1310]